MIRLVLFWWCLWPLQLFAQLGGAGNSPVAEDPNKLVKFKHFTIKDGLPTNVVNSGIQEKRGFIWLGTRSGLTRYDGQVFKTFTISDGLPSNNVIRLAQIEDDWLWLICGSHVYEPNLGGKVVMFNTVTHEVMLLEDRFPEASGLEFKEMKSSCDSVLILYSNKSQFFIYSKHRGLFETNIEVDTDNNFLSTSGGLTWVSREGDVKPGDVRLFSFDFEGQIVDDYLVTNLSQCPFMIAGFTNDNLPIGSVHYVESGEEVIGALTPDTTYVTYMDGVSNDYGTYSFFKNYATTISLGGEQGILFRPPHKGFYFKPIGGTTELLLNEETVKDISNGDLRSMVFSTDDEKLWICGGEGLFKIEITQHQFETYLNRERIEQANAIRSLYTDSLGNLFIAADQAGLTRVGNDGAVETISPAKARVMFGRGKHLYFNLEEVFYQYDLQEGTIKEGQHFAFGDLWSGYVDRGGKWWFGGSTGIARANNWNGDLKYISNQSYAPGRTHSLCYEIFEADESFWFVTSIGVYQYDTLTQEAHKLGHPWLNDVHQVLRDGGVWWFATNGNGLVRWKRKEDAFSQWTKNDGLSSGVIYACLNDDRGNLWLSSDFGIMKVDTADFSVRTFTTDDGLPHNELNRISWNKSHQGYLYFGGVNGVVKIYPDAFDHANASYSASLEVSSFLQYDEKIQRLVDLTTSIRSENRVVMKPENGFFVLTVNLLDFNEDQKKYVYRLGNVQSEWASLDRNVLQLGGLPYGTHQLSIKGQNQRGQWSTHELSLSVEVLKPFYLQLWFIIPSLVGLLSLILFVIRWRTQRLKRESERLQGLVNEQTQELQRSVAEKDVLLREVHHRVKNNLQIISSLLNLERTAGHDAQTLQLIKEARHRIKSMALIHKNLYQQENLSHILVHDYFNELMSGLNASYNNRKDAVTYGINSDLTTLDVDKAVPLGIIITEVATNAFKYAFNGMDNGLIELSLAEGTKGLKLTIKDNGAGLPEELKTLESKSLGLRLVKLLIGQLKGTVEVVIENGTAFIFEFPK